VLGFIGVAIFSLTLPVTKLALSAGMSAPFTSFGRAIVAGLVAGVVLLIYRRKIPAAQHLKMIALATIGIVFGWPTMSALGMQFSTPSHAAIVNGLLPFSTAVIGAILTQRWPSKAFWCVATVGAMVVCGYAYWRGGAALHAADAIFLGGVVLGGLGYAAGARVSEALPGWEVISWALVLGLPITIPVGIYFAPQVSSVPATGWFAFLYLALMSQYIGFFFWYRGLALGGIARVSQVQLLQIFLTLIVSALLVGEVIDAITWFAATATVAVIAISKRV
jgi:drug/metabolite transporter (DMT)-like permease